MRQLCPSLREAQAASRFASNRCSARPTLSVSSAIFQGAAMIIFPFFAMAAALATPDAAPAAATAFLSAVASDDRRAAAGMLAADSPIRDYRGANSADSTLEAYAAYARACRQGELTWDVDSADPRLAAVTVRRECPSREAREDFIWIEGDRVAHVQFGRPLAPAQ